ncbi:cupin domain-containing protein [Halococcus agarilyticus]|uniref:cupin domain-containing protein n=1 Tax=Halococcus agarilyticus TaxID=1232219 RepID=UPI0006782E8A|nr:cupin domain-containing protein [Halococcus agarilyticus]
MEFTDESERSVAGPRVVRTADVPLVDLSERDDVRPTVDIRPVDEMLGLAQLGAKLWHFRPGEEIGFHAHTAEEELYYVLEGEFSLKLGSADDPTYETVGPGTFFAALPREPHGHRCVGDEPGVVLAVGASTGEDDEVFDPHSPN